MPQARAVPTERMVGYAEVIQDWPSKLPHYQPSLQTRGYLRLGLLQSHPHSRLFQGDTNCLRLIQPCLVFHSSFSCCSLAPANPLMRRDLSFQLRRALAPFPNAVGRSIAPCFFGIALIVRTQVCARLRNAPRISAATEQAARPTRKRESYNRERIGKELRQSLLRFTYSAC
jgi:hypothetical protein